MEPDFKDIDRMRNVAQDARRLGAEFAHLLSRCPISQEEKHAWAQLVPFMTIEELGRFRNMLLAHMEREVFHEAEDVMLQMKGELLKRTFRHTEATADATAALDRIEKAIDAKEGAL